MSLPKRATTTLPLNALAVALAALTACGSAGETQREPLAVQQSSVVPVAAWDDLPAGSTWTAAVLSALDGPGRALIDTFPSDAANFCPAFESGGAATRKAFWVSFLSVLAGEESTWREDVSGGDGRWHGLLQISPATARGYGCESSTADGLKSGPANLACGVRIMAATVARDGVIAEGRGGVAADWGPLQRTNQREKIAEFTRRQSYCRRP